MIVVMKPGATKDQVKHVVGLVCEFGLKDHFVTADNCTAGSDLCKTANWCR